MDEITYPSGQIISYDYDDASAITDVDAQQGSSTLALADYQYDNMGRLTDVFLGDGGSTTYDYDLIGRLETHDLNHSLGDINLTTLAYNPSSQIVSRSVTQSSYQTAMPSGSPAQYTPNNLNQYTFADGSLSYDLNGNLTAYDGWTFSYDAHNRMKSATGPGTSLTLAYDPTGRLHSTTLGTSTTEYVYSGEQLIGEYTQAGNPINLYVYPPASSIPIARFSGSAGLSDFQYLRSDERGSIVAVTDDIVLERHQYDVYGVPLDGSSSLFRYTGQILLPGTELYHYKARVYHPALGRFMQTDPIGYSDGMNVYAYVGNDPMNSTDPTGKCPWCIGAILGGGIELGAQLLTSEGRQAYAAAGAALARGDFGGAANSAGANVVRVAISAVAGAVGQVGAGQVAKIASAAAQGQKTVRTAEVTAAVTNVAGNTVVGSATGAGAQAASNVLTGDNGSIVAAALGSGAGGATGSVISMAGRGGAQLLSDATGSFIGTPGGQVAAPLASQGSKEAALEVAGKAAATAIESSISCSAKFDNC